MNKQRRFVMVVLAALLSVCSVSLAARVDVWSQDFESGLGPNESTRGDFMINNTNATLNNLTYMMGQPFGYLRGAYDRYLLTLDLSGYSNAEMSFEYKARTAHTRRGFNLKANGALLSPTSDSHMQYSKPSSFVMPYLGQYFYWCLWIESGVARFDLSAYDNTAPSLLFQFYAHSGYTTTGPGINFDNILVTAEVLDIGIDIKPHNTKNAVNLKGGGALSVAILGSETLDVSIVDPTSLELAGSTAVWTGKPDKPQRLKDLNRDGFMDLMLAFPVADLDLADDATQAALTGRLLDGTRFLGVDEIQLSAKSPFGNTQDLTTAANPEPATLSLLALGALVLLKRKRRRSCKRSRSGVEAESKRSRSGAEMPRVLTCQRCASTSGCINVLGV